jgi:hypothetical protein
MNQILVSQMTEAQMLVLDHQICSAEEEAKGGCKAALDW